MGVLLRLSVQGGEGVSALRFEAVQQVSGERVGRGCVEVGGEQEAEVVLRVGVALSCAGLEQLHSALVALREAALSVLVRRAAGAPRAESRTPPRGVVCGEGGRL